VLPAEIKARIAVEQGSALRLERYIGAAGRVIGKETFGAWAPLKELQRKSGFQPRQIVGSRAGDAGRQAITRENDAAAVTAGGAMVAPPCAVVIFGAAGDATLFQRANNIAAGWQAMQPILDACANNPPQDFPNYAAGSSGPAAAEELLARDGRAARRRLDWPNRQRRRRARNARSRRW
jgi:Glucose-6-phosphate dehydrogenase, C-terminal domain